jgi:hypothetical protein
MAISVSRDVIISMESTVRVTVQSFSMFLDCINVEAQDVNVPLKCCLSKWLSFAPETFLIERIRSIAASA